jgi:hypothetical protein
MKSMTEEKRFKRVDSRGSDGNGCRVVGGNLVWLYVIMKGQFFSPLGTLQHYTSPEEAEAIACLHGVRLATEWIRQPIVVESDCQTLIKTTKERGPNRARWAGIIQEIKALSNLLPECNF